MIKAILLDIDNTLLDFLACARSAMEQAADELGVTLQSGTYDSFVKFNRILWKRVEDGTLTQEELFRTRWSLIFQDSGVEADGYEFEQVFLWLLKISAVPVSGAMELLQYLGGKYRLCVASNAPYEQQVRRLERAGMLCFMEQLFISGDLGVSKPSPEFFRICLERLGDVQPDEVLMLGDNPEADIQGAHDCGLVTCWYCPGWEGERPVCADYVIRTLDEIRGIL